MKLKGYHGTNEAAGDTIIKTQHIIPSTKLDEWLGEGGYFFWDKEDAQWWCNTVRKYDPPFIIGAEIESDNVLDLVGNYKHQRMFNEICKFLEDNPSSLNSMSTHALQNYNGLVIKLLRDRALKENRSIDVILGMFWENRLFWRETINRNINNRHRRMFTLVMGQIQICVYNEKCIKKLYKE